MTPPACGAATYKKTPCRARPFATTFRWDYLKLTVETIPTGLVRCYQHLTPDERDQVERTNEEAEQRRSRVLDGISPACWLWPLPVELAVDQLDEAAARQLLEQWQDGRCAACGRPSNGLVEDHDHATGLVRGLLDRRCNGMEARWHRDDCLFDRYRERPPTKILGLRIRYVSPITGPDWGYAPQSPVEPGSVLDGIGL